MEEGREGEREKRERERLYINIFPMTFDKFRDMISIIRDIFGSPYLIHVSEMILLMLSIERGKNIKIFKQS